LTDLIDNTAPNSPSWLQFAYNNGDLQTITSAIHPAAISLFGHSHTPLIHEHFDDPDGLQHHSSGTPII
jgi:hypothetical protein